MGAHFRLSLLASRVPCGPRESSDRPFNPGRNPLSKEN
ncbi:hypothetical protein FIC_01644 [Flavobacteriaceae bacterium 3519-10]|nr:hypothetical protein FIC_01644 [Flavobacteriaceae bacterium 3519-10]